MAHDGSENLVKISPRNKSDGQSDSNGVSRRSFLKILGAGAAAGVAGCADDKRQNILPFVKGEAEQIPGIAVWYRSTCTECTAGCGTMVRTREGRAVKVEGSPDNPINGGGLCALGQSQLQSLYDPDRVRQPIKRNRSADRAGRPIYEYKPLASWDEGFDKLASSLKDTTKKKAFVTGELTGALAELVDGFCAAFNATHVTWDPTQPMALAKASELVYGTYGIPNFHFDKADVILNFGADFVETWVSPVQFARGWAKTRKTNRPARVVHVEPRLSLSGANADLWLSANPGTETSLAYVLIKKLLENGKGSGLPSNVRTQLAALVKDVSLEAVVAETGVAKDKILLVAEYLGSAQSPLVIAGGSAASTTDPLPLMTATALLNVMLDSVGKTVDLSAMRQPKTSAADLEKLVGAMKAGEYDTLITYNTNPSFTFPGSFGFNEGRNMVPLVVSLSSQLDETGAQADYVLPSHTTLETWGDARPMPGVFGLIQPSMRPVFDTKPTGDILIAVASKAGKSDVAGGAKDFEAYLKNSWKKLHGSFSGVNPDFNKFWLESLERGGYFTAPSASAPAVRTSDAVFGAKKAATPILLNAKGNSVILFPYFSVRTFDGRAANRPWLQELPDPITTSVWDSWVEMHPDTAAKFGIEKDDAVILRNEYGELNVGVYLTQYIKKDVVAIPIGQGHTAYGRYARELESSGNVFEILPPKVGGEGAGVALLSTMVEVMRGRGKVKSLVLSGSESQHDRGIGKTDIVAMAAGERIGKGGESPKSGPGSESDGEEEAPPKQMYVQREHPLYRWGLTVDLAACTGCSACVVACSAENNIPIVGKDQIYKGREMSWLRIERYYDGGADELQVNFVPMMCQQCGSAPCEPVCPVFATYHTEEGLNAMIYNRCVGTRYCSNNCPYKVRRFNWYEYIPPEPLNWQLNPDVTKRSLGVMEKCTFCVQRIAEAKDRAKDLGRIVEDGEIQPACVQTCPTQALTFGNLNDPESEVSKNGEGPRGYKILDKWLNTQPAVTYLKRVKVEA